jgi:hypothetical protein
MDTRSDPSSRLSRPRNVTLVHFLMLLTGDDQGRTDEPPLLADEPRKKGDGSVVLECHLPGRRGR